MIQILQKYIYSQDQSLPRIHAEDGTDPLPLVRFGASVVTFYGKHCLLVAQMRLQPILTASNSQKSTGFEKRIDYIHEMRYCERLVTRDRMSNTLAEVRRNAGEIDAHTQPGEEYPSRYINSSHNLCHAD